MRLWFERALRSASRSIRAGRDCHNQEYLWPSQEPQARERAEASNSYCNLGPSKSYGCFPYNTADPDTRETDEPSGSAGPRAPAPVDAIRAVMAYYVYSGDSHTHVAATTHT